MNRSQQNYLLECLACAGWTGLGRHVCRPRSREAVLAHRRRTDPEIKMYRRGVTGTMLANVFTSLEAFLILFGVGAIVGILANW